MRRWLTANRALTSHGVVLVLGVIAIAMTLGSARVVPVNRVAPIQESDPAYLRAPAVLGSVVNLSTEPTESTDAVAGSSATAPASTEPTPIATSYVTHQVAEGDTLLAVAERYGVDMQYLIWNNPEVGADPDSLIIGQNLMVPTTNGIVYDVRLGDTVTDIASTFGVDPSSVVSFAPNDLDTPDLITEGMVLLIPGAVPPAPAPDPEPVPEAPPPADNGGSQPAAAPPADPIPAPVPAAVTPPPAVVAVDPGFYGYIWPGSGPVWSGFGPRWGSFHKGIDIGMGYGQGIAAAAAGQVILSTYSDNGYGSYVIIRHGDGSETLYAHMSERYASLGQYVNQGDIIGAVGCTGWCSGAHLHFEVHIGGVPVNPLLYLP